MSIGGDPAGDPVGDPGKLEPSVKFLERVIPGNLGAPDIVVLSCAPSAELTALPILEFEAKVNGLLKDGLKHIVVNLEPRKMAGEVSEAMFFDLGYADGIQPALAVPERPVPNGTRCG